VIKELGQGDGVVRRLMERLRVIIGSREPWIPAYNYDFCKTGIFRVLDDPAQIGALPEYYRRNEAEWRTNTPVFSICGSGTPPALSPGQVVDPFGVHSEFHQLCRDDGLVLFYGVLFSPTMTHYVERVATPEGPLYRYDKLFHGEVWDVAGEVRPVSLRYHVIPRGVTIKYDMIRLQRELIDTGAMRPLDPEFGKTFVVSARELTEVWGERLSEDPYYLLDDESRRIATTLVSESGGERLRISSFDDEDFGSPPTR
jgi:aminoglycoside 3-N-acetyltransferase